MKRLIWILVFLLSIVLVAAFPPIGHQFYGSIAWSSSEIDFYVVEQNLDFYYNTGTSEYGYDPIVMVPADDPDTVDIEGAEDSDTLEIYIDGGYVGDYIFEIEGITNLDFTTQPTIVDDDDDDGGSSGNDGGGEYFTTSTSGGYGGGGCNHYWRCGDWGECNWVSNQGLQTRDCEYEGTCSEANAYPPLSQECEYVPTCYDDIQNQGEEGIDCGGPCPTCPATTSCYDGLKNQGEEGIDCGGPCPACAVRVEMPQKSNLGKIIAWIVILIIILGLIALAYIEREKIAEWYIEARLKYQNWRGGEEPPETLGPMPGPGAGPSTKPPAGGTSKPAMKPSALSKPIAPKTAPTGPKKP